MLRGCALGCMLHGYLRGAVCSIPLIAWDGAATLAGKAAVPPIAKRSYGPPHWTTRRQRPSRFALQSCQVGRMGRILLLWVSQNLLDPKFVLCWILRLLLPTIQIPYSFHIAIKWRMLLSLYFPGFRGSTRARLTMGGLMGTSK
jgi:hypothetical protein